MTSGLRPADLCADHTVISQFSFPRGTAFAECAAAAAAAGFDGLGISAASAAVTDPQEVVDCLAAHRIVLSELEGLQGWGADGADGQRFAELEPHVHAMADATGARHMQVWGSYTGAIKSAAERFGEVCDRAADHGLLVALEFLPFTNVFDAATALEIVERAGRPNGGICVDVWHHERGARCTEQLRAIPPECVVGVQLDDGARIPVDTDYYTDCVANRLPPGEGEFDVVGFLALLSDIGADAPLAVEVLSDAVQTSTPTDVAVHLAHATRGVRQAAGYSVSIL